MPYFSYVKNKYRCLFPTQEHIVELDLSRLGGRGFPSHQPPPHLEHALSSDYNCGKSRSRSLNEVNRETLKYMILTSLMTALMIVGAYIRVPIGPVPFVLTNMFVFLAGLFLGPKWGSASVALYLFLGLVGLPVFSGGGGPGYFAGPTGGYLIGYLGAAAVVGLITPRTRVVRGGRGSAPAALFTVLALAAGIIVIYAFGIPWLKLVLDMSWGKALAAGFVPFLLGDVLKAAAAAGVKISVDRFLPHFLPRVP